MGYILICIGIVALISGIWMVFQKDKDKVKDEISTIVTPTSDVLAANNTTPSPTNEGTVPEKDTVVIERVVERIVEKEVPQKDEVSNTQDSNSNKDKGDAFEDFVVNILADWRLSLLDRTQDKKSSAGVIAESSKNPDLHVQQKRGKGSIDYYLECKYRSHWNEGAVTFEEWQLNRYRQFQRSHRRKVIITLGVGGTPSSPATLRLVPLDSIKTNSIREIDTQFAVSPTSSALVDYMDNYFTGVFKKSKKK